MKKYDAPVGRAAALVVALALMAAACGGDDGSDAAPADEGVDTSETESESTEAPTTTEAPPETTEAPTTTEPPTTTTTEPAAPDPVEAPACFGSTEGASCWMPDGSWLVPDESVLGNTFVSSVGVCLDQTIYVGGIGGLARYDGGWAQLVEPFEFDTVDHIACWAADDLWVGGFDAAAHWDGSEWEVFPTDATGGGIIDDLELDADGNPWFATSDGIATYDGSAWTVYDESNTFSNDSADDLSFAADGTLEALLLLDRAQFDGSTWTEIDMSGTRTALGAAPEGLYIGSFNQGLELTDGGVTTVFNRGSGALPSDSVNVIEVDANGRTWIATDYGVVVMQDGEVLTVRQMLDGGLHDDSISTMSIGGLGPELDDNISAPAPGSMSGVIADETGPVAGATVEICVELLSDSFDGATPCELQPFQLSTTTGADGSFTIADVPRGRYVFATNTGAGWIQALNEFGTLSARILVEGPTDIGTFVATAS